MNKNKKFYLVIVNILIYILSIVFCCIFFVIIGIEVVDWFVSYNLEAVKWPVNVTDNTGDSGIGLLQIMAFPIEMFLGVIFGCFFGERISDLFSLYSKKEGQEKKLIRKGNALNAPKP